MRDHEQSSILFCKRRPLPLRCRDSAVTELGLEKAMASLKRRIWACRGSGASERELEALAIYMGHSLEMQRGSYDR